MNVVATGKPLLSDEVLERLQATLPELSSVVVDRITEEVPSYAHALSGPMGAVISDAVRVALGGFITLMSRSRSTVAGPQDDALAGAYDLGRGEAKSGRTADALLSAYRIGARVCWESMSKDAVAAGAEAETIKNFAGLVFDYIDQLSAASVAGHSDQIATAGRVRERILEVLGRDLLEGADTEVIERHAASLEWQIPATLTAVLVPDSRSRSLTGRLGENALIVPSDQVDEHSLVLVPDAHGRPRQALLQTAAHHGAVVGPAKPIAQVRVSAARAVRVHRLCAAPGVVTAEPTDTDDHLASLVIAADREALEDLRAKALAPLAELTSASRNKLAETLRAWLLHRGRREDVARALFLHPQTIRYRMGRLRELFGDSLDDPQTILELIVALGLPLGDETADSPWEEATAIS